MTIWIAASLYLSIFSAPVTDDDPPAPEPKGKLEKQGEDPPAPKDTSREAPRPEAPAKGEPKPSAAPEASKVKPGARAVPQVKPAATEKLREAMKKMETQDYEGARSAFNACLKDAATPADKKLLQGLIDDTKLGTEVAQAQKMAERKDERKAIAKVEKAIKQYPESALRPDAEKFIRETEELIYLILDDFEPGDALSKEAGDAKPEGGKDEKPTVTSSGRLKKNMSYNTDPRFVRHGKGSLKWRVGGDNAYFGYRYWYDNYGYRSLELKNPITKWRSLCFWVFLPEVDDGNLRVTLAPDMEAGVYGSLYSQKFIEFRGKRGWLEVRMDLSKDFGNTKNVRLEDIRFVRIDNMHVKYRTIYVDFIHFE